MIELPNILPGTKFVSLSFADGTMAVKVARKNDSGEQLYGLYTQEGVYLNRVMTMKEVREKKGKI